MKRTLSAFALASVALCGSAPAFASEVSPPRFPLECNLQIGLREGGFDSIAVVFHKGAQAYSGNANSADGKYSAVVREDNGANAGHPGMIRMELCLSHALASSCTTAPIYVPDTRANELAGITLSASEDRETGATLNCDRYAPVKLLP